MIQIKGSEWKVNDKNSCLLPCLHRRAYWLPQTENYGIRKPQLQPTSSLMTCHGRKSNICDQWIWVQEWNMCRWADPSVPFPVIWIQDAHFPFSFMYRLFFPAGSLQLDSLVWLLSTLVEGINKPITSKVQSYFLIHLYKWLADFLIFHLHYLYTSQLVLHSDEVKQSLINWWLIIVPKTQWEFKSQSEGP